ncbi:hypothetical protein NE619_02750 [Anaerovorax odorimutans]|uniref:Uncharacterized protein n=1 Tax=Anaerovorax odorimutans TaxID=109327 RepID=A0ABT1RKC7_9FIRM|nr:hypothetical protein [Anaerovorax odorimutans]MCQ4635635.1 hypothetical protein [Anaerovorax odorimutans]
MDTFATVSTADFSKIGLLEGKNLKTDPSSPQLLSIKAAFLPNLDKKIFSPSTN